MKYAEIIHNSWELTTGNPKLKWLVFVPSFVAVLVFVLEICWQLYVYLEEFGAIDSMINFTEIKGIFHFLSEHNLLLLAIFAVIFILFFAFIVPSWVIASLVLSVKQKIEAPEKYCSVRLKMIEAFGYFFRLFELHAVLGIFSVWSFALFMATFFRYFHDSFFQVLWPALLIYFFFTIVVTVFTSFAAYFLICENHDVTTSIKKSFGLVMLNFGRTLSIILLMFLVNFRVILNVILILLVPIGLFAAFSYFSNSFILVLAVILGVFLLAFTAYLTAILEVFSTAVWTESFLQMRKDQEALIAVAIPEKNI